MVIPVFNVVLISDKDKNVVNNNKHVLSHLSKCSDKFHGNIVYKMQTEMSNFIQLPASLVFVAISEFWFSGFSSLITCRLTTSSIACFIKINSKKLDQTISKPLMLTKYEINMKHFWTLFEGIYVTIGNNYKLLKFKA